MTFYHFINCVVLTYAPYFVVYKSTSLAEESLFNVCSNGGCAYGATKVGEMILVATLLPNSDTKVFILSQEVMKAFISIVDVFGLHFVLKRTRCGTDQKVLAIGLGWAFVDAIFRRLLPLWIGARGVEFEWQYIQMSVDSNITLISSVTLTALVWMAFSTKGKDSDQIFKDQMPILVTVILCMLSVPVISGYLLHKLDMNPWMVIAIRAAAAVVLAGTTKIMYERNKQFAKKSY
jgi:hypothetical protein